MLFIVIITIETLRAGRTLLLPSGPLKNYILTHGSVTPQMQTSLTHTPLQHLRQVPPHQPHTVVLGDLRTGRGPHAAPRLIVLPHHLRQPGHHRFLLARRDPHLHVPVQAARADERQLRVRLETVYLGKARCGADGFVEILLTTPLSSANIHCTMASVFFSQK